MEIKYVKKIALAFSLVALVLACSEDPERADYVGFQGATVELVTPATGSGDGEYKVYTTHTSGSARTFEIVVDAASTADPAAYTVPTSVTVPANSNVGTFTVESGSVNIGKSIILKFALNESTFVGAAMRINVYEECLQNLLFLDILFDIYSEEFAWEILDSEDNFVAGNEGFGEYPRATFRLGRIRERICLPAGTYTFAAYDAYGDGLADGSNLGNFALKRVSDGAVLASGEGAFEDGKSFEFTLP